MVTIQHSEGPGGPIAEIARPVDDETNEVQKFLGRVLARQTDRYAEGAVMQLDGGDLYLLVQDLRPHPPVVYAHGCVAAHDPGIACAHGPACVDCMSDACFHGETWDHEPVDFPATIVEARIPLAQLHLVWQMLSMARFRTEEGSPPTIAAAVKRKGKKRKR